MSIGLRVTVISMITIIMTWICLFTFAITKVHGQYPDPSIENLRRLPDVRGTWYLDGDLDQPCYIQVARDNYHAIFINERGDRSPGVINRDGTVAATKWRLYGRFSPNGRILTWDNDSEWAR